MILRKRKREADYLQGKQRPSRRVAMRAAFCAVLALSMVFATSCRDSDALKEIIYDQSSSTIDYDNPHKYYINDSTSKEDSDKVSSVEVSNEDPESDVVQNLIIYSSEPNSEGYVAKQSKFSINPDFYGIEASQTVFFEKSNSVDAIDHAVTATNQPQDEADDDQQQAQTTQGTNSSGTSSSNSAGLTKTGGTTTGPTVVDPGGGSQGGQTETPGTYDPNDGFEPNTQTGDGVDPQMGFDYRKANATASDYPASSFAAFGSYASLVQMVGGSGALVATDYNTLCGMHNAGLSNVGDAANGILGDISVGWRDGGTAAYLDVNAIITAFQAKDPEGLAAGTCYIIAEQSAETYFSNYGDAMTQLNDAGIKWINLHPMDNTADIKQNVTDVASMLEAGFDQNVSSHKAAHADEDGEAEGRATYYASLHDTTILDANDGLAIVTTTDSDGGTHSSSVLQTGSEALGASSNKAYHTVLANAWDASALFTGKPFAAGMAFASMGCTTTPVSYYIQAGGAINTAAAYYSKYASGEAPVLQFSQATLTTDQPYTTNIVDPFTYKLTSPLLDSKENVDLTGTGNGLGSSDFPKMIVTSSSVKTGILASSALTNSLYHPFGWMSTGFNNGYGYQYGNSVYWSCIGKDGSKTTTNPLGSSIPDSCIAVLPSGYFCDWTAGTVESFLVSGWTASQFGGQYSYSQWVQDVKDFYIWAYDVSDVDVSGIISQ